MVFVLFTLCCQGYRYAGLQQGSLCYCGESYGSYGISNNCTVLCSGDNSTICGGESANSIFDNGSKFVLYFLLMKINVFFYRTSIKYLEIQLKSL